MSLGSPLRRAFLFGVVVCGGVLLGVVCVCFWGLCAVTLCVCCGVVCGVGPIGLDRKPTRHGWSNWLLLLFYVIRQFQTTVQRRPYIDNQSGPVLGDHIDTRITWRLCTFICMHICYICVYA